jgi:hypothetical protein
MTPGREAAARRDLEGVTPSAAVRPRLTLVDPPKPEPEPRTSDRLRRAFRTVAAFFAVGPSPI